MTSFASRIQQKANAYSGQLPRMQYDTERNAMGVVAPPTHPAVQHARAAKFQVIEANEMNPSYVQQFGHVVPASYSDPIMYANRADPGTINEEIGKAIDGRITSMYDRLREEFSANLEGPGGMKRRKAGRNDAQPMQTEPILFVGGDLTRTGRVQNQGYQANSNQFRNVMRHQQPIMENMRYGNPTTSNQPVLSQLGEMQQLDTNTGTFRYCGPQGQTTYNPHTGAAEVRQLPAFNPPLETPPNMNPMGANSIRGQMSNYYLAG